MHVFLMSWVAKTISFVFLYFSMLSIGMHTSKEDVIALLKPRGHLIRLLLANFVVVPIVGVVFTRGLTLSPGETTAFLLLSCTPGGLSALQFTGVTKGGALFAGSSTLIMSLLAIFISPLLLELALPQQVSIIIPYERALLFILLLLLFPLALGLLIRHSWDSLAKRLATPSAIVATITATIAGWLIAGEQKQAIDTLGIEELFIMLMFSIVCMIVGWYMGGRDPHARAIFAIATGMRNVALCLLISLYAFPDPAVEKPLVAFSAVMIFPSLLYYWYLKIRSINPELLKRILGKTVFKNNNKL